jgi:hypothetical protein
MDFLLLNTKAAAITAAVSAGTVAEFPVSESHSVA